ncbi:MAG: metal ABC transporter permease [Candidatus Acetothermia bacterium]|jgi:manganese/iron transport system permease protein|nr:metal ABC transporter permease [Candidatus Acetothermia bacterium]
MVEFLLAPLAYPFMVRALLAAAVVGATCGVVGTYVVLRGMAFFGDALAHAILPGVAVGYLVHRGNRGAILLWALGTAAGAALGIGALSRRGRFREDTAIGIVFVGLFALGIALISTVRGYAVDLAHFLFGNVLSVSPFDLGLTGGIGGAVVLAVVLFYKEFLVVSFDPTFAATLRLRTGLFRYLLLLLIAVTVVISLQAVGVALVLAMLITPPATAYLLARRLPGMMVLSAAVGVLSGVVGLYVSFYVGIASGASIVLVATACFLFALPLSRPRRLHLRNT